MAKKRRRVLEEKEKEYEFKAPEFDKEEHIRKELAETKPTVLVLIYAILLALASFAALVLLRTHVVGLLVGLFGIILIKHYFRLVRVDTTKFEKKSWAGHIAMLFFTWLAIWVLLVNPPVSDFAHPDIQKVEFSTDGKNWTDVRIRSNASRQVVQIRALVTDNYRVDPASVKLSCSPNQDGRRAVISGMTDRGSNLFHADVTLTAGWNYLSVSASDAKGNPAPTFAFKLSW